MPLKSLDHVTVRCADLDRSRAFYGEVLGLRDGERPAFGFPGAWFYLGERPVVHLFGADGGEGASPSGAFDHVAFEADDLAATLARLERLGVPHRRTSVPGVRLDQVFVHDPDGIMIELNFRG
jgi:catechol 2,3-dioxygenase-like lactoylglutathione lyase family enzyme